MRHDQNFKNLILDYPRQAIALFAALDENERIVYRQRYPEEVAEMTRFAERFMEKGREEGREEAIGQGEARVLLRLLTLKFGALPEAVRVRVESADAETLLHWSERVLSAQTLDEVLQ
jgi:predicted transposase YdaD